MSEEEQARLLEALRQADCRNLSEAHRDLDEFLGLCSQQLAHIKRSFESIPLSKMIDRFPAWLDAKLLARAPQCA